MKILDIVGVMKGSSININGSSFSGSSVTVENDKVYIDGKLVDTGNAREVRVEIRGDVGSVKTVGGDVYATGEVGSITTTSGDVKCIDVKGNVSTVSGDVDCGKVSGRINTVSGDVSHR